MTRTAKFMKGLEILFRHEPEANFSAEHDEFFFGSTPPEKLTAEDRETLYACGWTWDKKLDTWHRFV